MRQKLIRLEAIADAAHAQLRRVSADLRDARDEHRALDRHRETLEAKNFKLSAADKSKLAELSDRIQHLTERYDFFRSEHRAKRDVLTRCKEFAHA